MATVSPKNVGNKPVILFVTHEFTRSGAPLCLLQIVKAVARNRLSPWVIGSTAGPLAESFRLAGATVVHLRSVDWLYLGGDHKLGQILFAPARLLINFYLCLVLLVRFKKLRPCVIHLNSLATRFAAIPARFSGAKVVWYLHEYITSCQLPQYVLGQVVSLCSDLVIANSHATMSSWLKHSNISECSVVYNGVSVSHCRFVEFDRKLYDVIFVGRISYEKGIEVLIDAVARLLRGGLRVVVAVLGTFEHSEYKQAIARLLREMKIEDLFVWLGSQDDPTTSISKAKALVLPSYREGLGRVLLEAMSCKVPVIATKVGGVSEIVSSEKIGLLIAPGDSQALAVHIRSLVTNRELNLQYAQAGYEHVSHHFSEERFKERIVSIYESFCATEQQLGLER